MKPMNFEKYMMDDPIRASSPDPDRYRQDWSGADAWEANMAAWNAILGGSFDNVNVIEESPSIEYSVDDYIKYWEAEHQTKMSYDQKLTLSRGCIGITALELGSNVDNPGAEATPPFTDTYSTFEKAKEEAEKLEKEVNTGASKDVRVIIYSVRFWSNDQSKFTPNKDGRIDMTGYDYRPRPATVNDGYFTNFDYGLYDKKKIDGGVQIMNSQE